MAWVGSVIFLLCGLLVSTRGDIDLKDLQLDAENDDVGEDVSDEDQSNEGESVVYHNGVPHLLQNNQVSSEHGDKEGVLPEEDRRQEIEDIVSEFHSMYPGVPGVDIESLYDLDDDEIYAMLDKLGPNRKRFVHLQEETRWDGGIIPYHYGPDLTEEERQEIEIAMKRVEKYTCIRFVPWVVNVTRKEYNLTHNGRVKFKDGDGCYSAIGRRRGATTVSCCRRFSCVHELGHAIGLMHEHSSPLRDNWVRINWQNIKPRFWTQYKMAVRDKVTTYGYDLFSPMHYSMGGFNVRKDLSTMIFLNREFSVMKGEFYFWYEISHSHQCKANFCKNYRALCVNEGYVGYVDGKCTCVCPPGLNPNTGCYTTIKSVSSGKTWPEGSFSLLAPVDGCPGNEFSQGEITHWSRAGSSTSSGSHIKGSVNSTRAQLHFCTTKSRRQSPQWQPGEYCIHRAWGSCPSGFEEGFIQFDNVIPRGERNTASGTLPDGKFGANTRFIFCCRNDGFIDEPLDLPNRVPFILYKTGQECQAVRGMLSNQEYYFFNNYNGKNTVANSSEITPKLIKNTRLNYRVNYCYYTPIDYRCGGTITLSNWRRSVVITSPNYPRNYNSLMECTWLIKAPKSTTILLNFDDFDIEERNERCTDSLEIRYSRVGQPGIKYCGKGMAQSIRSHTNLVSMTLRSDVTGNKKGFKVTASLKLSSRSCYKLDDQGKTYRGLVNFTRDMKPCLPWALATNCTFHAMDGRSVNAGLDGNYCRNPGNGLQPWCYTGYSEANLCERNYCDVCLQEKLYDTIDYCSDLLADDTYCREDPLAFSQCAASCNLTVHWVPYVKKVSLMRCRRPSIPLDGLQTSPVKSRYRVGETVSVRCKISGVVITGTCLSDWTWNIGTFVCGVCPNGWIPHDGHCFKYFKEALNYTDATNRCGEFGGIIAPARTIEEENYLISLREFLWKMWVGADDTKIEGRWVWQDGGLVRRTNWAENEPKGRRRRDCAYISSENLNSTWKAARCDTLFVSFVCRIEVPDRGQCVDRQDDCEGIFKTNPRACLDFPDFAQQECRLTCSLCGGSRKYCMKPRPSDNSKIIYSPSTSNMKIGSYVSYACADGFVLTSGNLVRGCMRDGTLTGSTPICKPLEETTSPSNDADIRFRNYNGAPKYAYTGPMSEFKVKRSGEITQWKFYSKIKGSAALQVWRKVDDGRYLFIGQNKVRTVEDRVQVVFVPPNERLKVKVGDFLGVYIGVNKAGVAFSICTEKDERAFKLKTRVSDSTKFIHGRVYTFQSTGLCIRFSITAMIGPISEKKKNTLDTSLNISKEDE